MKTIKQIADEIGVDKQKIYRYIKREHINDVHREAGVIYIDDVLEIIILKEFKENEVNHDAHQNHFNKAENDVLIEMLKKELDSKNEQLLNMQKLLDQEQQLRMMIEQKNLLLEEKSNDTIEYKNELEQSKEKEKTSLWNRIFKNKG